MRKPIYEVNLADTTSSAVASEGPLTVAESSSRSGKHPAPWHAVALCSKVFAAPRRTVIASRCKRPSGRRRALPGASRPLRAGSGPGSPGPQRTCTGRAHLSIRNRRRRIYSVTS